MELHKLAFPDRPQPMLVDEEVGTFLNAKSTVGCWGWELLNLETQPSAHILEI